MEVFLRYNIAAAAERFEDVVDLMEESTMEIIERRSEEGGIHILSDKEFLALVRHTNDWSPIVVAGHEIFTAIYNGTLFYMMVDRDTRSPEHTVVERGLAPLYRSMLAGDAS